MFCACRKRQVPTKAAPNNCQAMWIYGGPLEHPIGSGGHILKCILERVSALETPAASMRELKADPALVTHRISNIQLQCHAENYALALLLYNSAVKRPPRWNNAGYS